MKIRVLMCATMVAAVPASAQEVALQVQLLPGHPVYHESEREAGVVMALSVRREGDHATNLTELCEELRVAAGLKTENDDSLGLETIFVVPYKAMAVEGYYWPNDGTLEREVLVPGNGIPRDKLDGIVARAGIPPRILDETNVEHEVSCETGAPLWHVVWHDIRPIGNEEPDAVIERAHRRFLAVYQSVVEQNAKHVAKVQRASLDESIPTSPPGNGSDEGRRD
jgi:hypothetical protein